LENGGEPTAARTGGAPGCASDADPHLGGGLTIREEEIREILVDIRRDLSPDRISPDTALRLLGFDSLDQIQMAVRIQQRYHVNLGGLDPGAGNRFETLCSLANFVDAEMSSRVPGRP